MDARLVAKVISTLHKYRDEASRVVLTAKELGLTELEVQEIINTWTIYERRPKE